MSTPDVILVNIDRAVNPLLAGMSKQGNPYLNAVILLFLLGYAAYAAPKLSPALQSFIEHPIIRFLFFFFLAYALGFTTGQSLFAAIIVLVVMYILNSISMTENFDGDIVPQQVESAGQPIAINQIRPANLVDSSNLPNLSNLPNINMAPYAEEQIPQAEDPATLPFDVNRGKINCPPFDVMNNNNDVDIVGYDSTGSQYASLN